MKTFSTLLNTEKNKKTGASPVWILKIPFVAGTVYLSDRLFTYTGITIKPWIYSWGTIDEDIVDEMGSPQVSDFAVDIIIDPDEATDIHDLLWSESVETLKCELYLWFEGLTVGTDPMVLMWAGNIIDFERVNELLYNVRLVDESVRIDKHPGRVLSLADYAAASLDDVGYQMPIIYGSVTKSPALRLNVGSKTTLMANITAAATDFYLTDGTGIAATDHIVIDAEEIHITTISGNHITACTRAVSGTAATHNKGALVLEKQAVSVFLFADHPVKSIGNIYAPRPDGVHIDVTSLCTKYTGQGGADDYAGYAGMAVVTCPGYITFEQAVAVGLTDGITVSDTISYSGTIGGSLTDTFNFTGTPATVTGAGDAYVTMPSTSGSSTSRWYEIDFIMTVTTLPTSGTGTATIYFTSNSLTIGTINSTNWYPSIATGHQHVQAAEWPASGFIIVRLTGATGGTYSLSVSAIRCKQNVSPTVTLSKAGSAAKAGTVTLSGGSSVTDIFVGDILYISGEGYKDDGSGTFTGTPSALVEQPDHIFKHFLYKQLAWPVASFSTDAATSFAADSYKFSMVINTRKRMKEWLAYMALQCRCWFRFSKGMAYLLYRPDALVSDKTITAAMIRMNDDFTTSMKGPGRSPIDEIINKINLYYSRNWAQTGAYQAIESVSDATSITAYGEKEKPGLFLFSFITDATMAADVAAFYLARYKDRKKVVSMDLFLDNAELEYADAITLTPLADLVGEVRKVNFSPGSGRDMRNDKLTITMREY